MVGPEITLDNGWCSLKSEDLILGGSYGEITPRQSGAGFLRRSHGNSQIVEEIIETGHHAIFEINLAEAVRPFVSFHKRWCPLRSENLVLGRAEREELRILAVLG